MIFFDYFVFGILVGRIEFRGSYILDKWLSYKD